MSATQDFVALDWIRGEITQTLEQAQQALEAVAEAPDDASSMRSCLTSIHQVHGTLKMVELSGPTQLAAEMEELAQALMNKSVPDEGNAEEVLMQSILQMQAYLDRIHREQQDRPGAIIPICNDLRVARGVEPLEAPADEGGEAMLPRLLSMTPDADVIAAFEANNGPSLVPRLRQRYQKALIALLKRQNPRENLNVMAKVFANLARLCGRSPFGYLSQLNIAVIEGIVSGGIKFNNRVSELMKQMERELKRLADEGAGALGTVNEDLGQSLFDLVQTSTRETPRIRTVRELFETREEQEAPSVSMGPDDETLGAVAKILKDEFNQITDKLDLYVRASARNPGDLVELLPMLEQISSTMSVVGLTSQQESVQEQVEVIRGIEQSGEEPDEEVLLDMARALLQIESLLGSMAGGDPEEGEDFGDLNEAQASVIRETRSGLARARDAVIEFVSSEWNHEKIAGLSGDLRMLRGGLQIVNQQRAADILLACAEYVDKNLIADNRVPDLSEMDDLADALTSIDYYLERLLESSSDPYLQMIEVAEQAVAKLGFDVDQVLAQPETVEETVEAPDAGETEEAEEPAAEDTVAEETAEPDIEDAVVADEEEAPAVEEEPAIEEEAAVEPEDVPTLEPEEPAEPADEQESLVDDEIVEIFVEESEGVLGDIREYFPQWRDNPADTEALAEVRRAFHTLKGSGRMVGATEMGELAWAVENMLNQVIEKRVAPQPAMMELVGEVVDRIPEGVKAFSEGRQEDFDVEALIERARTLAESQTPAEPSVEESIPEEDVVLDDVEVARTEAEHEEEDELDELFLGEAEEHLQTVRKFLEDPSEAKPELVAAFHTLKGSAGMAGIETISGVAAPLEALAARLHQQRDIPGQGFVALVHEGVRLIEEVMADLANSRHEKEGLRDFVLRAEAELDTRTDVEPRGFDFENVRRLADPSEILRDWDGARVEELVGELSQVRDQATTLGYQDLLRLVDSLLRVYEQLSGEPADEVIEALQEGHERLVIIFDEIAADQDITPAPDIIERIEAIDLGALETDKETQYFLKDCWETLGNLDAAIRQWEGDIGNLKPLEQISQHLSTLEMHAESRQANNMISLLEEMIRLCEAVSANELAPGKGDVDLLNRGRQSLIDQLEQIRQNEEAEPDNELLTQFRNRIDQGEQPEAEQEPESAPEAESAAEPAGPEVVELPPDKVDEDVLPIFLEEADELLENIDQSVLDWSNDTSATEHLDNLLRHLHTLKGGSRLAGLASLGEYTHNLETWLIGVKSNPVPLDDAFFALLNRRQDEITRRVEIYRKLAGGEATDEELESLKTVVEGGGPAPQPARSTPEPEPADETAEAEPQEEKAPAKAAPATPPQEVVRVSADLLDTLISLVGESSITRARVEQQISDFSISLEEMEQTINRIREQVRRLEIETESRETLIRARDDREGDSPFDELEMDRYTLLQEISRALSESASDMLDLKETLTNKSRDAETLLHQQARIGTELQEGLTRTTMVPFARLIPRLRRIVRQVSNEIGKSVRFDAYNVEGELDRTVLERIVAPLEHMLRNAVDHGIEEPGERKAANKPETGRISLRLSREGAYVVLTISDDGAGIDVDAIRRKAIERGLMTEDSPLSDHDVMQFIMHAGLSTAKKVTQISGRGVGMDVVDSELKQLGGSMTIDSTLGVGTEFTVRLPFTVSINRALMVVVGEETYAVPLNTIEGVVRVSPYELEAYYQPDAPMFEYAGQPYRLMYMGRLLNKSDNPVLEGQIAALPVLLGRSGDNAVALQVDRVIGSREVVVKSLGPQFSDVAGVSGATVLGDGSVVVILDVMALVRNEETITRQLPAAVEEPEPARDANVRTVLIVDDSVTVRKVTSRLMERQGWEVITAKDGVEAVERLQEIYPDVMLLDIEMPRMDGFEVLRTIRRDDRLKDLPVIMITSRTGEKHQQQAKELGVNSYLGKPFQEANLLSTIEEILAD